MPAKKKPRHPLAHSVWSQPLPEIGVWKTRGVTTLLRWEEQLDAAGKPTVNLPVYLAAAKAAGMTVSIQLDAVEPIPYVDATISSFLQPDGTDNAIVNCLGNHTWATATPTELQAANAVIQRAAAFYATAKTKRPDALVYMTIDGWQEQWKKFPYAPLLDCCDRFLVYYYYDVRGETPAGWLDRMNDTALLDPNKFDGIFIGCSDQNLNTSYYPNQRPPTVESVSWTVNTAKSWKCGYTYFPQSFPPPKFIYDATPPDIAQAITALDTP